jgi:hypothetical protein
MQGSPDGRDADGKGASTMMLVHYLRTLAGQVTAGYQTEVPAMNWKSYNSVWLSIDEDGTGSYGTLAENNKDCTRTWIVYRGWVTIANDDVLSLQLRWLSK